jgi:hypothetical protein
MLTTFVIGVVFAMAVAICATSVLRGRDRQEQLELVPLSLKQAT